MLNTLSIPRPEFNGYAACPWIKKYQHRIEVVEVEQGVKAPVFYNCSRLQTTNLMAVCLVFSKKTLPHHVIKRACDEILNLEEFENIDILLNNHRLKGTVRGVYTGFAHRDLVIIQDKNKLHWARESLKKQGYYK